jgi:predicted RNase H-like nuclease (RuvC/YqgF family)
MATATAKKPRVDTEAVSQLSHLPERVGIVETKVESIKEQLTDLKADVKEMHDCLDNTRDLLADKLEKMQEEYRTNAGRYFEHADKLHAEDQTAHIKLASRIGELEKLKSKWTMYAMAAMAFIAGTGWLSGHSVNIHQIIKFLGL